MLKQPINFRRKLSPTPFSFFSCKHTFLVEAMDLSRGDRREQTKYTTRVSRCNSQLQLETENVNPIPISLFFKQTFPVEAMDPFSRRPTRTNQIRNTVCVALQQSTSAKTENVNPLPSFLLFFSITRFSPVYNTTPIPNLDKSILPLTGDGEVSIFFCKSPHLSHYFFFSNYAPPPLRESGWLGGTS